MLKKEAVQLFNALNALSKHKGAKFAYAVAKNIAVLKEEIDALNKTIEPTEKFKAYDAERIALLKKYAQKDENKEPVIKDNQFILSDTEGFNAEFEQLQETYKEALAEMEEQKKGYEELLTEDVTLELTKIKEENLPDTISVEETFHILSIIE